MSKSFENALSLEVGDRLLLADGSIVEITENPRDGVWLFCRYLSSPDATLADGVDQPVYASDIVGFAVGDRPGDDHRG